MIRKCYSCGNTFLIVEHGKAHYHYYLNNSNYCPECGKNNTSKIKVEELRAMIISYKSATYEHGYDIKKLESILEAAEMLETLDKMSNKKN